MIEITGLLLQVEKQNLKGGKVLHNHHVLINGGGGPPSVVKVQDWECRSFPLQKQIKFPVRVAAWKSKTGFVGVQFTLEKELAERAS
jgi:hypothetical protein